jgi:hypothetical protein
LISEDLFLYSSALLEKHPYLILDGTHRILMGFSDDSPDDILLQDKTLQLEGFP